MAKRKGRKKPWCKPRRRKSLMPKGCCPVIHITCSKTAYGPQVKGARRSLPRCTVRAGKHKRVFKWNAKGDFKRAANNYVGVLVKRFAKKNCKIRVKSR